MTELSICITASTRQRAVNRLIASLDANVKIDFELVIVNNSDPYTERSLNRPENLSLGSLESNLSWYNVEREMSISEHRHVAQQKAENRYVWWLDDDLIVPKGTAEALLGYIRVNDIVDGASCVWRDKSSHRPNKFRPAGWMYSRAYKNEEPVLLKQFVRPEILNDNNFEIIELDCVQGGSLMIDTEGISGVEWDPQYRHYWEIEDYMMQATEQNNTLVCALQHQVVHNPMEYEHKTLRHNYDDEVDEKRFKDKWGMRVLNPE